MFATAFLDWFEDAVWLAHRAASLTGVRHQVRRSVAGLWEVTPR